MCLCKLTMCVNKMFLYFKENSKKNVLLGNLNALSLRKHLLRE